MVQDGPIARAREAKEEFDRIAVERPKQALLTDPEIRRKATAALMQAEQEALARRAGSASGQHPGSLRGRERAPRTCTTFPSGGRGTRSWPSRPRSWSGSTPVGARHGSVRATTGCSTPIPNRTSPGSRGSAVVIPPSCCRTPWTGSCSRRTRTSAHCSGRRPWDGPPEGARHFERAVVGGWGFKLYVRLAGTAWAARVSQAASDLLFDKNAKVRSGVVAFFDRFPMAAGPNGWWRHIGTVLTSSSLSIGSRRWVRFGTR